LALGEECLLLLILLITEMPAAPDPIEAPDRTQRERGGRVARQLRRELVHRLASAPCTHSELQDTCYATSHNEVLEAELMETILADVATRREPSNALEAGRFVLKPEVFTAEYDSTFFHQSLQ
ncbi:unnamed protein product, partial [Hapterophycus canaliculatus]